MIDDGGELSRNGPWKFLRAFLKPAEPAAADPSLTFSDVMNALQKRLRPFFHAHGFQGRGRNVNRASEDGLIQVVNFQVARFGPIEDYDEAFLDDSLYGKFTVNLGVFIPEAHEALESYKIGNPVPEVSCHARVRLGELGPEDEDLWWHMRDDDALALELEERLERDGFPFFAGFASRDLYLAKAEIGDVEEYSHLSRIVSAAILNRRGDKKTAGSLLAVQLQSAGENKAHIRYIRQVAARMGLGDLPD